MRLSDNHSACEKIGKTEKTVYRAIKSLKENGYIVREGTDTSGYWKILK
jgi:predicted HTH transcriptional regulator